MLTLKNRTPGTLRSIKRDDRADPPCFKIRVDVDVPAPMLDTVAPGLEAALFKEADQGDLLGLDPVGTRTAVRFPDLAAPVVLHAEKVVQNLIVHSTIAEASTPGIALECRLLTVGIQPHEGGRVTLALTLSGGENLPVLHAGSLTLLMGRAVSVELVPLFEKTGNRAGTVDNRTPVRVESSPAPD